MNMFSVFLVFTVLWWLVFFAVLPIGVRSQHEAGAVAEGTEPGAPAQPMLKKKAIWATIGAAALTVVTAIVIALATP